MTDVDLDKTAEGGTVDRMQAEAEAVPLGMPEGAPPIKEFHQLRRRQKQQISAVLADLMPKVEALQGGVHTEGKPAGEVLHVVADVNGLFADMEEFCVLVAVDETSMDFWVQTASEQDLLAVFSVFTAGLGEAESSSN